MVYAPNSLYFCIENYTIDSGLNRCTKMVIVNLFDVSIGCFVLLEGLNLCTGLQ